ncbi:MAG: hypothetical protein J6S69_02165, partial [Proteobacteria bacterium]|nr:hypothetical protein [Pseudomonadota bacterium]
MSAANQSTLSFWERATAKQHGVRYRGFSQFVFAYETNPLKALLSLQIAYATSVILRITAPNAHALLLP